LKITRLLLIYGPAIQSDFPNNANTSLLWPLTPAQDHPSRMRLKACILRTINH
jgi:hypothetical protein